MTQSAIFVDPGFLLAVGGAQVAETSLRSAFRVGYKQLIEGILKRTDEHQSIGLLPDVKVRLGRISFNGEQKGVVSMSEVVGTSVRSPQHSCASADPTWRGNCCISHGFRDTEVTRHRTLATYIAARRH